MHTRGRDEPATPLRGPLADGCPQRAGEVTDPG
jgi:hypothetical protein